MGDIMRPVPFKALVHRIFEEYAEQNSIFGIQDIHFFKKQNSRRVKIFSGWCDTPVGPAAGPHTQLAQNIVAGYLSGGRFIELKTVQKLDTLEIEKPCIDARDEGYNTEWSTEFTLEKAFDEYLKAWFVLHLLEEVFGLRVDKEQRSFLFNMSVGYDLEGLKSSKMDYFINSLMDASGHPGYSRYIRELDEILSGDGEFLRAGGLEGKLPALRGLSARISPNISSSVTLSTMHGCPPEEQESICEYLLNEKKIDTYLKLNPTLLGYEKVREILDHLGFDYLHLSRESFLHDLQYSDAVEMLGRLMKTAENQACIFGIKLSNTLGSINDQGKLPGQDMYMSGRALYPLTIHLAARLSEEFQGRIPISYSGGANAFNADRIFAAGIRPVTAATELLKPGGYTRLREMALKIEASAGWDAVKVDVEAVKSLARDSLTAEYTRKAFRGTDRISVDQPLPLFDCYTAPCTAACPIGQDVPEYVRLLGEGRYADALDLIYEKNALPNITSHICDHQCMYNCTRLDYEGPVRIRDMKRLAAEKGWQNYVKKWEPPVKKRKGKAAVIGAGPAGLSAAYFLAREGFSVTVFEKHESAGGVVRHVIPGFRLPVEAIEKDVEFIRNHGVEFIFGCGPRINRDDLVARGFTYIFLGIGAEKDNLLMVENGQEKVLKSLDFLRDFRSAPGKLRIGKNVVVVGGGNTAMDSARAALKSPGVESVTVLYRRSLRQMPADLEEYENALDDGVVFQFLSNPERIRPDGSLEVRRMKLGEPDASGRPRPVPTDDTECMRADTIISAIGEKPDTEVLKSFGLPMGKNGRPDVDPETLETKLENVFLGGDANTGPSTVVQCIAAGRRAAEAIIRKEEPEWKRPERSVLFDPAKIRGDVIPRKGALLYSDDIRAAGPDEVFAAHEAARCLQCSYVCDKCVEVCPNRANMVIEVPTGNGFTQDRQIIHIDAFCNECGNCETFCPWEGKPYKDKFTVFNLKEDFESSENSGFFLEGETIRVRMDQELHTLSLNRDGGLPDSDLDPRAARIIETVMRRHGRLLGSVEI